MAKKRQQRKGSRSELKTELTKSVAKDNGDDEAHSCHIKSGKQKPNCDACGQYGTECQTFPRNLHWWLFIVTMVFRLWYVSMPTNWWILHPDEIYQTLEVAHSEVYHYGFRPYEYMPPPPDHTGNVTLPEGYTNEIKSGMFSLRSFILVKFLSFVLKLWQWCGAAISPYMILKYFHVVITSTLPVAVFKFAESLCRSSDVGSLSAIFVCSSVTLNVLGTHTFINSFLAPFVFLSLVPFVRVLRHTDSSENPMRNKSILNQPMRLNKTKDTNTQEQCNDRTSNILTDNTDETVAIDNDLDLNENYVQKKDHSLSNGIVHNSTIPHSTVKNGVGQNCVTTESVYQNGIMKPGFEQNGIIRNGFNQNGVRHNGSVQNGVTKNGGYRKTVIQNGVFQKSVKCNPVVQNESFTHKTTDESVIQHQVVHSKIEEVFLGLLLALCVYMRIDVILLPMTLSLVFYKNIITWRKIRCLQNYSIGFIFGILIGGYIDNVTYAKWFISPQQWFTFNVWNNLAGTVFGKSSWAFYFDQLFENEPLMVILAVVLVTELGFSLYFKVKSFDYTKQIGLTYFNYSAIMFAIIICFFSLNEHKEVRFLHNVLVLFYIAVASALLRFIDLCMSLFSNQNERQYYIYLVYIFITLFVSSQIYSFRNITAHGQANWTYDGITDSNEVNVCLDYIRQQDDVTGLFLDKPLYMSGGFTVLHKNVPIIALNKYEFLEYDIKSRVQYENNTIFVSKLGRISDFISVENAPLLAKLLIQKKEFNYVVLELDRPFLDIGYHEVFRVGNNKILKRSGLAEDDLKLAEIEKKIPVGSNATVLEYEGQKLIHFGLYQKAEERLLFSNRLDRDRLGPFRVLMDMYSKLGAKDRFQRVLKACMERHTLTKCSQPYQPIRIHDAY